MLKNKVVNVYTKRSINFRARATASIIAVLGMIPLLVLPSSVEGSGQNQVQQSNSFMNRFVVISELGKLDAVFQMLGADSFPLARVIEAARVAQKYLNENRLDGNCMEDNFFHYKGLPYVDFHAKCSPGYLRISWEATNVKVFWKGTLNKQASDGQEGYDLADIAAKTPIEVSTVGAPSVGPLATGSQPLLSPASSPSSPGQTNSVGNGVSPGNSNGVSPGNNFYKRFVNRPVPVQEVGGLKELFRILGDVNFPAAWIERAANRVEGYYKENRLTGTCMEDNFFYVPGNSFVDFHAQCNPRDHFRISWGPAGVKMSGIGKLNGQIWKEENGQDL